MKTIKTLFAGLAALLVCVGLLFAPAQAATKVGISLPVDSGTSQRWARDAEHMRHLLQTAGYDTEILHAPDAATQAGQISTLLKKRSAALIVAPVDSSALAAALRPAKAARVPVIALDKLILDSTALTALVAFDIREAGRLQGAFIRDGLNLDGTTSPRHIELFAGLPTDAAAILEFEGAMDILVPYFNRGKLLVRSKEISQDRVGVSDANPDAARVRMTDLATRFQYGPTSAPPLNAILSPTDTMSQGIVETLRAAGYKPGNTPVLTGMGCGPEAMANIKAGMQSMCVNKDSLALAAAAVNLVDAALTRTPLPISPESSYHNGAIPVPTLMLMPQVVTN